jgi:hypothetical protein
VIWAYAPSGATFPAQSSSLNGFLAYSSSGTPVSIPGNYLSQSNYTRWSNNTVLSARVTFCTTQPLTTLVMGFGFDGGNSVCATLTR